MASQFFKNCSEEEIDFKCSICYKRNKERKSEKFCRECQKHFCVKCLEAHNLINDDHALQEPAQAAGQVLLPTERCIKHPEKIIDTYCKDHDDVGCSICSLDTHRSCLTVLYIPNVVEQLFKEEELQQVRAGLDRVRDRLTEGGSLRDRRIETLKTEREKQLAAVDSYVETLVDIIRNLGKAERAKLEKNYKDEEDILQQNADKCAEVITCVQKYHSQLVSNIKNTVQLFVNIKKSKKTCTVADRLLEEIHDIIKHQVPQFKSEHQIEQYLFSLETLGTSVDNLPLEEIKQDIKSEVFISSRPPAIKYCVRQKWENHIKIKGDSNICNIVGSCLLPDGSLLLSDNNNKKLKLLDTTTFTVTDHYDLPARPNGVCCISHQEAAVCFYKSIQFVSLGPPKISPTRSFKTYHYCIGISYWDKKLCVSNGQNIWFYTLSGSQIRSINLDLQNINGITFSQLGDVLYIADGDFGLIGVDMSGQEIFRYKGLGLNGCPSVCVDYSGSVFVVGCNSKHVFQVTETGQPLGEVVPQSAGLKDIQSLCFDFSNRRLFVAGWSDKVTMIEMA